MSAILPKVDTWNICEIYKKKTWRVSLSIGVRTTMVHWVVYLLWIFKIFHGLMNNPVCLSNVFLTSNSDDDDDDWWHHHHQLCMQLGRKVSITDRSELQNCDILQIISGDMERSSSLTSKVGTHAVATHSDTKRNVLGSLTFAITVVQHLYHQHTSWKELIVYT